MHAVTDVEQGLLLYVTSVLCLFISCRSVTAYMYILIVYHLHSCGCLQRMEMLWGQCKFHQYSYSVILQSSEVATISRTGRALVQREWWSHTVQTERDPVPGIDTDNLHLREYRNCAAETGLGRTRCHRNTYNLELHECRNHSPRTMRDPVGLPDKTPTTYRMTQPCLGRTR